MKYCSKNNLYMEKICLIRNIHRSIRKFEAYLQDKFSICLNEAMLLCILNESGRLSSGDIANELCLTPSNTSKVLKSAEDKNLIERVLGASDKRQMYFILSEYGRQLLKQITQIDAKIDTVLRDILSLYTEEVTKSY